LDKNYFESKLLILLHCATSAPRYGSRSSVTLRP